MKRPLLYTLYIMCIAALLSFTSCSCGIHEQGNALAIEIVWDENSVSEGDDADTPPDLTGITVYIYGTDGTLRDGIRYNNGRRGSRQLAPSARRRLRHRHHQQRGRSHLRQQRMKSCPWSSL